MLGRSGRKKEAPAAQARCDMPAAIFLNSSCFLCFSFLDELRVYLTLIPQARMGSESIAHKAEGRMGY